MNPWTKTQEQDNKNDKDNNDNNNNNSNNNNINNQGPNNNHNTTKQPTEKKPFNTSKRQRPSQGVEFDFQPVFEFDLNTAPPPPAGPPGTLFLMSSSSSSFGRVPPPSPKKTPLHHRRSLSLTHKSNPPLASWYQATFEAEELIGSGHYGDVFKCRHKLDGVEYAVKKLKGVYLGFQHRELLLKEVFALARCNSRHIVRYYNAWEESDRLYIQTEYCDQGNLSFSIGKYFPEIELLRMLKHISKALKHLHSQDLVHLDIKPENIFIKISGKGPVENSSNEKVVYKLGDFGLASSSSLKNGFPREGDGKYLAREILQENDTASLKKGDIFSLGATIYELATMTPLASHGEEYHALRDNILRKSDLYSEEFWNILERLLHRDPNIRPSAIELLKFPLIARLNKDELTLP